MIRWLGKYNGLEYVVLCMWSQPHSLPRASTALTRRHPRDIIPETPSPRHNSREFIPETPSPRRHPRNKIPETQSPKRHRQHAIPETQSPRRTSPRHHPRYIIPRTPSPRHYPRDTIPEPHFLTFLQTFAMNAHVFWLSRNCEEVMVPEAYMFPSAASVAVLTASAMDASSSSPMPHCRTSIARSTSLCSRASRIRRPPSGPKALPLTSSCTRQRLVFINDANAAAVCGPMELAARLSFCKLWLDRSTSQMALPPSSPSRLSRSDSVSTEWLERSARANARPPSVCTWLSLRSTNAMTERLSRSFASARTPRSAILLWLRSRCTTERLSTIPLATIRILSSSRRFPLRLKYSNVSARSMALANARQSLSFIPNKLRS
mmetsp:Transcript_27653/g.69295  ORF Transcript_27653/g.69295 Transcript_27653/m.69295 type:complete len:377 (-) Transcript_27653:953-2083(-)